jgi:hypothetical protein
MLVVQAGEVVAAGLAVDLASPALVDPANDAPVARLVVGRRPRWGGRPTGRRSPRLGRAAAPQRRSSNAHPGRADAAVGPNRDFRSWRAHRRPPPPTQPYAPVQSPSIPRRARAVSQRAELHASCATRDSRIFAVRRFPSLRSGQTPATNPGRWPVLLRANFGRQMRERYELRKSLSDS